MAHSTERLFVHWIQSNIIRILEVVVFVEEEIPVAEKNPQSRIRTNNKLKTTKSRIWTWGTWETLTTVPSLLPFSQSLLLYVHVKITCYCYLFWTSRCWKSQHYCLKHICPNLSALAIVSIVCFFFVFLFFFCSTKLLDLLINYFFHFYLLFTRRFLSLCQVRLLEVIIFYDTLRFKELIHHTKY